MVQWRCNGGARAVHGWCSHVGGATKERLGGSLGGGTKERLGGSPYLAQRLGAKRALRSDRHKRRRSASACARRSDRGGEPRLKGIGAVLGGALLERGDRLLGREHEHRARIHLEDKTSKMASVTNWRKNGRV